MPLFQEIAAKVEELQCEFCKGVGSHKLYNETCARCGGDGVDKTDPRRIVVLRDMLNTLVREVYKKDETTPPEVLVPTMVRIFNTIDAIGNNGLPRNPANKLESDYNFDSLDSIEFVMALEEEFNIEIPDDDADMHDPSVQAVYDYLNERGVV